MIRFQNDDTIAAIATPPGKSAIAVIRVSGKKSFDMVNKIFPKKDLKNQKTHTIHLGPLYTKDRQLLDEVLVSVFKHPNSYTGEDLIEISSHGSVYIISEILKTLTDLGARLAQPGEFTYRAFRNKKLDLSRVEAIADIIDSESKASHTVAISQMRGGVTIKLKELRDKLIQLTSLIELEIDFSEENVEFASVEELEKLLLEISIEVKRMLNSFKLGNVMKKGVSTVIAGPPNSGKSTLLNTLLEEEKAITSHIPGTTRDLIEDVINIQGIDFRFIDTAGITETENEIEKIGIKKTFDTLKKAEIIIYLFDLSISNPDKILKDLKILNIKSKCLLVGNKADLLSIVDLQRIRKEFIKHTELKVVFISSKFETNIKGLKKKLFELLEVEKISGNYTVISNSRHYSILSQVEKRLREIKKSIKAGHSKDLLAIDVRYILNLLGEITGEVVYEEVLENIFSRFCIGK